MRCAGVLAYGTSQSRFCSSRDHLHFFFDRGSGIYLGRRCPVLAQSLSRSVRSWLRNRRKVGDGACVCYGGLPCSYTRSFGHAMAGLNRFRNHGTFMYNVQYPTKSDNFPIRIHYFFALFFRLTPHPQPGNIMGLVFSGLESYLA